MNSTRRRDPCIFHRAAHAEAFVREYLSQDSRHILLVAGGGFDPRSTRVSETLIQAAPGRIRGVYLREERPNPAAELVRRADQQLALLQEWLPTALIWRIQVLAVDNAAVGGRNAVALINQIPLDGVTDIFVDVTAHCLWGSPSP